MPVEKPEYSKFISPDVTSTKPEQRMQTRGRRWKENVAEIVSVKKLRLQHLYQTTHLRKGKIGEWLNNKKIVKIITASGKKATPGQLEQLDLQTLENYSKAIAKMQKLGMIQDLQSGKKDKPTKDELTKVLDDAVKCLQTTVAEVGRSDGRTELSALTPETLEKMHGVHEAATLLLTSLGEDYPEIEHLTSVIKTLESFKEANMLLTDLREIEVYHKACSDQPKKLEEYAKKMEKWSKNKKGPEPKRPEPRAPPCMKKYSAFYVEGVTTERTKWKSIRKSIFSGAIAAQGFLNKNHTITWITGSRSASIPLIERVKDTALSPQVPALVPTGQLLRHNIAPLTGEFQGITLGGGVNTNALSGMTLEGLSTCMKYTAKEFEFDPTGRLEIQRIRELNPGKPDSLSRVKVAVLRLHLMGIDPKKMKELERHIESVKSKIPEPKPEKDWNYIGQVISEVDYAKLKEDSRQPFKIGQMVAIPFGDKSHKLGIITSIEDVVDGTKTKRIYTVVGEKSGKIFRLESYQINSISQDKLKEHFQGSRIPELTLEESDGVKKYFEYHQLEDILHIFKQPIQPLDLSGTSGSLINESFPLVWGSCTLEPKTWDKGWFGGREELVSGIARLGTDIQVVFTETGNVGRLKTALEQMEQRDITVLSFEAAKYIMGQQCYSQSPPSGDAAS